MKGAAELTRSRRAQNRDELRCMKEAFVQKWTEDDDGGRSTHIVGLGY